MFSAFRKGTCESLPPDVGGGFGQKMSLPPEYVLLVCSPASTEARSPGQKTGGKPDRELSQPRPARHAQGAFDQSGSSWRSTPISCRTSAPIPANPTTCGVEALMAMAEMQALMTSGSTCAFSRGVTTKHCPMAPYRGVSRPVITFTIERLMDKAARALQHRPDRYPRRNLIDKFPYTSAMGLVFDEATYKENA